MLLVNFDKEIDEEKLRKLCQKDSLIIENILDFTCKIKDFETNWEVFYAKDLDQGGELHEQAIKNYVSEIGKVSNAKLRNGDKLRDIKIGGFPIYWLTELSLKHAQSSVLKNYFYLLEIILQDKIEFSKLKYVKIILPGVEMYFANLFIEKLEIKKNLHVECCCVEQYVPVYSKWSMTSFYKGQIVRYFKGKSKCRKILENSIYNSIDSQVSIFTYPYETWRSDLGEDYVFKALKKRIDREATCTYTPIIVDLDKFVFDFNWDNNWDGSILRYYPNYKNIIDIVFSQVRVLKKLKHIELSNESEEGLFINTEVIRREIYDVIFTKYGYIFYYNWLKRFIKQIKVKKKLIYQDEFYHSGRVISLALNKSKNSSVMSFGYQHGVFFEGHTVYSITENEISGKNSMPIPDKFIVWGALFKKLFLRNNSLPENYVAVSGNLKYLIANKDSKVINKKKVVLWCTTLESDTRLMYSYLRTSFDLMAECVLIVRCHPLFNLSEDINKLFRRDSFNRYEFSNSDDILDDIRKADILISSNASTTFIDGLALSTPVINIILPDYYLSRFENVNLHDIEKIDEFRICFNNLLMSNSEVIRSGVSDFSSKEDIWSDLLAK